MFYHVLVRYEFYHGMVHALDHPGMVHPGMVPGMVHATQHFFGSLWVHHVTKVWVHHDVTKVWVHHGVTKVWVHHVPKVWAHHVHYDTGHFEYVLGMMLLLEDHVNYQKNVQNEDVQNEKDQMFW